MADDYTQRPYRSNQPPARGTPAASPGSSGSDPLAELARLIGQSDPFAEFGRDGARRAAAPRPAEPVADWPPQQAAPIAPAQNFGAQDYYGAASAPAAQPRVPQMAAYVTPNRGRQPYGADLYHPADAAPRYPGAQAGGYEADPYQQNSM